MWLFGKNQRRADTAQRRRQRACRQRHRLSYRGGFLERLEDRRLLAITADFVGGVLTFSGDSSNDQLTITAADSTSSSVSYTSSTDMTLSGSQTGVTAIIVNLDGGTNDSLTINGSSDADAISINGTTVTFVSALAVDVTYTLANSSLGLNVENLFVNSQLNNDTVTATGASVSGHLSFSGGDGTDALSVNGPLTAGRLTVEDSADDVELSGSGAASITTTAAAGQDYQVRVTLVGPTTLNAGAGAINFDSTVVGLFSLEANSTGTTTFGGVVNIASLTTNALGTTAINGGLIVTPGDQIYGDAVTLNAQAGSPTFNLTALRSDTGSVRFDSALNSFQLNEEDLAISTAVETIFNGAVGTAANGALASLIINGAGTTRINGGAVMTTLNQIYSQPVTLNAVGNATTLTSSAAAVQFNSALNSLQLNEENLSIDAGTSVTFNGTVGGALNGALANLEVDAGTNIILAAVTVVTSADLTATAGQIIDLNASINNITATSLIANAATGINLDTTIANLSASNTTTGGIDIDELDDVSILTISAPGQTVDLSAGGAISDGNAAANNITAASLVANAVTGISLDTTIANLLASNTTSGGIDIDDVNDVTVLTVSAPGQIVDLSAGGAISDGNAAANNIAAASLIANAVTGISLDTAIANLSASNTTSGGVDIDETDALTVLSVTAVGQTVDLNAGGAIDEDNDAAADVTSASLILQATGGIDLDTSVTNFTANNDTSGDIVIDEAFAISILSATNDGGNIQIVAVGGPMNITTADSAGFFVGSTSDTAEDDLVVTGSIKAQSFVSLIAGDDITLSAASDVQSVGSFVYMKVDASSVDAAGGTLILLGTLQGDNSLQYPVVAEGDSGDDLFSIQKLPQSPIAILARGGSLDNTFIVFTDAAENIDVFATIVDLVGQPGIEITYVDNEQLDLVTLGGDDKVFVQMPEPAHGILANIVRTSTGAGEDLLKINGSTLNDTIRVSSYTTDPNYRFQVRGDTGETECLHIFGFLGDDIIENSAPVSSLLDGSFGSDFITGGDFSVQPATMQPIHDVIFGGPEADTIFARSGDDYLFPDHLFDQAANTAIQTVANGDVLDGGFGFDTIVSLGNDQVVRNTPGDEQPDQIIGQGLQLNVIDFLNARFTQATPENVAAAVQEGLARIC